MRNLLSFHKERPWERTAGIYRNPNLEGGVISYSSDNITRTTIADKNLGATKVRNNGDEVTAANGGGYFQWGNNYMFPFTGPTSTSSSKISVTSYGPSNYLNSSTFILDAYPYDTSQTSYIFNLWGGTDNTVEARRGPCPSGYHIPSSSEGTAYFGDNRIILKVPQTGFLSYNNGQKVADASGKITYRTSSSKSNGSSYPYVSYLLPPNNYGGRTTNAGYGAPIRPFRNTPILPGKNRIKLK